MNNFHQGKVCWHTEVVLKSFNYKTFLKRNIHTFWPVLWSEIKELFLDQERVQLESWQEIGTKHWLPKEIAFYHHSMIANVNLKNHQPINKSYQKQWWKKGKLWVRWPCHDPSITLTEETMSPLCHTLPHNAMLRTFYHPFSILAGIKMWKEKCQVIVTEFLWN